MAESFLDSFKTELIADRVWRTRSQLELAVVEFVAWFNTGRLHSSLGYRTPAEVEAAWRSSITLQPLLAQAASTAALLPAPPSGLDATYDPIQTN